MNTLVFDIETVPDTDLGRRLHDLKGLSDAQVAQIMFAKRRQETGSDFLSHEQHRVVAISVAMRSRDSLKVWSLGDEQSTEKDLIERFFDLRPGAFREELRLHRPVYQKTAAYGHFGRDDPDFTWEQTDKAAALADAAGLTEPVPA